VLERTHELSLLFECLESSMAKLGRSVDELEFHLLQSISVGWIEEGLSEGQNSLLGSHDTSLEDEEIVVHLSVSHKTSNRGNSLLGEIKLGGGAGLVVLLSDSVDLLVHFCSVVVSMLTSTRDSIADSSGMPGSDTSNLSQTLVRLSGKLSGSPTGSHTFKSLSFGDSTHIDHSVLLKDGIDWDLFLKQIVTKLDLLLNSSTINLNLHNVGLLLHFDSPHLGVSEHTNHSAVFVDSGEFLFDNCLILGDCLRVLGEGFLLRLVPILVEPPSDLLAQVSSPHSG